MPETTDAAVSCDGLVSRYGTKVAVDGLSFSARAGEVVALLGPNGAGKTTTVETLEGYRPAQGGSVRVLGLDPRRDRRALVPDIGVMLQKGGVYPALGPARVLQLFAGYYGDPEDPGALLDLVGLTTVRRTPWRRLSGGEQQRLSLALALVGRPRVLFLDEPTAGVDPEGRLLVRALIGDLRARGLCVLLTTHELTEAERLSDRVVIIDRGRKLAEGSPAELTARTGPPVVHFSTAAGIDVAALGRAAAGGAPDPVAVVEERPGTYRVEPPPGTAVPALVAAVTAWLAGRGLVVDDLRTGQSLEEVYLAVTGEAAGTPEAADRGRRRSRGRGDP